MNKLNLDCEQILNKEFNVDFKGYAASEVDQFLDVVLEDYQKIDDVLNNYNNEIDNLKKEIANLKANIIELESNKKVNDAQNTNSFSSIDLLKRVSRLEKEVFK